MYIYVAQDTYGNVYVTDEKDSLPPYVTSFHEVHLADLKKEYYSADPTLSIEIQGYSEIVSLTR